MAMTPSTESVRLPRSPHWRALRARWLEDNPTCAACGCKEKLEVHHIIPVHVNRSLELDAENLITLCEVDTAGPDHHCHLKFGHLGNWYNYNRNVTTDTRKALLKRYTKPSQALGADAAQPSHVEPEAPTSPVDKPASLPAYAAHNPATPSPKDQPPPDAPLRPLRRPNRTRLRR